MNLWDEVVGQGDTVERVQRALVTPVHAYLFVGPPGSGVREMAKAAAAELLAQPHSGEEAERARRLVAAEAHPCLDIVEREGQSIAVETAREVVRRANLTPPEGDRQVMVLVDFHLVREAAATLLKTIEEPPPGTFFIVLAEEITPELVTIASRCMRFDLRPVDRPAMVERLLAEGVSAEAAEVAAAGAGGDLGRARLLARDPSAAERRRAWFEVVGAVDGTGATAARLADELLDRVGDLATPLETQHAEELAAFEERWASVRAGGAGRRGGPARGEKGERDRIEARHKRELRRLQRDELLAGLAALIDGYRVGLADGRVTAESFVVASEAVLRTADGLRFNRNERLALQALLLKLPGV